MLVLYQIGEFTVERKRNILLVIINVLLVLNLCATVLLGVIVLGQKSGMSDSDTGDQYVMYVGTNDKDTYEQIIPTDEAKNIIDRICFKYLDGYTIQDAVGSWVDDSGVPTHENTIVCYFDGADAETVYKVADEILKALNQNSVLIEKDQIRIDFYGGK